MNKSKRHWGKAFKRYHCEYQALDGYVAKKHSRHLKKSSRQEARNHIRNTVNDKSTGD